LRYHFGPVAVLLGLLVLGEHVEGRAQTVGRLGYVEERREGHCEDREAMRSVWNITTVPTGKMEKG
jgi:hypothetical protein